MKSKMQKYSRKNKSSRKNKTSKKNVKNYSRKNNRRSKVNKMKGGISYPNECAVCYGKFTWPLEWNDENGPYITYKPSDRMNTNNTNNKEIPEMELNDTRVGELRCGHIFHKECLKPISSKQCPLCRQKFEDKDILSVGEQLKYNKDYFIKMFKNFTELNLLEFLETHKIEYSNVKFKAICEALKDTPTITSLNINNQYYSDNRLNVEGAILLVDALKENTILTMLNISKNYIDDKGATALANILNSMTALTTLDISSNQIGMEGATALANALENNNTLTTLIIKINNIKTTGVKDLANILNSMTALTTLDISSNQIGMEGAKELANALENNNTLTTLIIKNNNIKNQGAKDLAKALEKNNTLTTLDISGDDNYVTDKGIEAIATALEKNFTLTSFLYPAYFLHPLHNNKIKVLLSRNKKLKDQGLSNKIETNFNFIGKVKKYFSEKLKKK